MKEAVNFIGPPFGQTIYASCDSEGIRRSREHAEHILPIGVRYIISKGEGENTETYGWHLPSFTPQIPVRKLAEFVSSNVSSLMELREKGQE